MNRNQPEPWWYKREPANCSVILKSGDGSVGVGNVAYKLTGTHVSVEF